MLIKPLLSDKYFKAFTELPKKETFFSSNLK
jgi:hypothetical protein